MPVSYTHLDVYKRQVKRWDFNGIGQLQLWPASGKPIRLWAE